MNMATPGHVDNYAQNYTTVVRCRETLDETLGLVVKILSIIFLLS
jgi:hypothetical protein